jgi:hypothetical protein
VASSPHTDLNEAAITGLTKPRLALVETDHRASRINDRPTARLNSREWSIVALAAGDSLASLREPGCFAKAVEILFGIRRPTKLANGRIETLRRVAVWAWRRGRDVPQSELDEFVAAGFTLDQFDLIQINIARTRQGARGERRFR